MFFVFMCLRICLRDSVCKEAPYICAFFGGSCMSACVQTILFVLKVACVLYVFFCLRICVFCVYVSEDMSTR